MRRIGWAILVLMAFFHQAMASEKPRFEDFAVPVYDGERAQFRIDTPEARNIADLLDMAVVQPVNFAGEYVLLHWKCGAACTAGAVLNIRDGKVVFLPFTVRASGKKANPFDIRPSSRLLLVRGKLDGKGSGGQHFLEFNGKKFVPAKLKQPDNRSQKQIPWSQLWEGAQKKPFNLIMLCYSQLVDDVDKEVTSRLSGPASEARFIHFGGNTRVAKIAMDTCDQQIQPLNLFQDEAAYKNAREVMLGVASKLDAEFLENCKSDECKAFAKKAFQ